MVADDAALDAALDFSASPPELVFSLQAEYALWAKQLSCGCALALGRALLSPAHWLTTRAASSAARANNFLKGVRWSPDGASLLSNSDDNVLRVYDVPADALVRPVEDWLHSTLKLTRLCLTPPGALRVVAWRAVRGRLLASAACPAGRGGLRLLLVPRRARR